MNRRAIARSQRRQQVQDALEFERARADALRAQLETIVAELDGPAVDEAAFALMDPADVEVVRPVVQVVEEEVPGDEEWLGLDVSEPAVDVAALREEEIGRLEAEIAASAVRQRAFERYLEALEGEE